MMEGFGVHTFDSSIIRKARFVKFHWKPLLDVHSVVWDKAQMISGKPERNALNKAGFK